MEGHETTRSGLVRPRYRPQWCAASRAAGDFDHANLGHNRIKIIQVVFFCGPSRAGRHGSVVTYRNFLGLGLHQVVSRWCLYPSQTRDGRGAGLDLSVLAMLNPPANEGIWSAVTPD